MYYNYRTFRGCFKWHGMLHELWSCSFNLDMFMTTVYTFIFSFILKDSSAIQVVKIQNVEVNSNSAVEILDTNVENLKDFTVCGRFQNPYLATVHDIWQNIVYISSFDMWLLAKVVIIDCDDRYEGCSDYYRGKLGNYK